jgi:hypothetical protein
MKPVYSNQSLALQKMREEYDIDLSGYYSLSNQERLKLLSRKRAINPSIYEPAFNGPSNMSTIESRNQENSRYNTING